MLCWERFLRLSGNKNPTVAPSGAMKAFSNGFTDVPQFFPALWAHLDNPINFPTGSRIPLVKIISLHFWVIEKTYSFQTTNCSCPHNPIDFLTGSRISQVECTSLPFETTGELLLLCWRPKKLEAFPNALYEHPRKYVPLDFVNQKIGSFSRSCT